MTEDRLGSSTGPGPGDAPLVEGLPGNLVAGKYQLIRLIGQGGMGAVYEGRNSATLKRVAVKLLLNQGLAQNPELVQRFFREAQASSVIESDHIVQIFDSGLEPELGFPYMVMELLQGEDLETVLRRCGALDPLVAARVIAQAATGLAKAHEVGTVHRDIKPANIFLTRRDSGELTVKLLDFGIAKVRMENFSEGSAGLTRTGTMLGTPLYMSPEQARGNSNIDARSDVWSLGVVLYEILSGVLPHGNVTSIGDLMVSIITADIPLLQDKAPWVPPELAEITHRAMSRDLSKRFATAGELRDALTSLLPDGLRVAPELLTPVPPERRACIAPRLVLTDDGMLHATTRTGLAVTSATAPLPRRKPSPALPLGIAAGALLVLGAGAAGIAAFVLRGEPAAVPDQITAEAPSASASASAATIAVEPVIAKNAPALAFELQIVPTDVTVQVDGKEASLVDGKVSLSGAAGDTRKVRLARGGESRDFDVVIARDKILPAKLDFPKDAAAPAARPGQPAAGPGPARGPSGSPPPAATPEPPKPKGAPKVSTDTSEFG